MLINNWKLGLLTLCGIGWGTAIAATNSILDETANLEDFDYLWSQMNTHYVYFGKKQVDWAKVKQLYRDQAGQANNTRELIGVLERTLDELYDAHTHLKANTIKSSRLVPTGLDMWAEWCDGKAVVTQLRAGFSAEQAGLYPGMVVTAMNGVPIGEAVQRKLGQALKADDMEARNWALRSVLAGTREQARTVEVEDQGQRVTYQLDQATHQTVDQPNPTANVDWRHLGDNLGYVRINNYLGDTETVKQFDRALIKLRHTKGLILDLRNTPSGGNTNVAEPILGRLIDHTVSYQKGVPMQGKPWVRKVQSRGWTYRQPVVVLVGRWTASIGEAMAIGLDAMNRATIVGTPMAGLNGAVFDLTLPRSQIRLAYSAERLYHMNGTPRETFQPPVLVQVEIATSKDPILDTGVETLKARLAKMVSR
ncbi:S41 family peptidase [Chitinivorax sp. B]|uniref:S41 family peptidase n=1 Tax=Chitinivorax sp. B TaxID=2502235 RepID=UPI0010F84408|nr:S41 family peptidase [Chitinivorax sp. B]